MTERSPLRAPRLAAGPRWVPAGRPLYRGGVTTRNVRVCLQRACTDNRSWPFAGIVSPLTDSNRRPPPYHEREEGVDSCGFRLAVPLSDPRPYAHVVAFCMTVRPRCDLRRVPSRRCECLIIPRTPLREGVVVSWQRGVYWETAATWGSPNSGAGVDCPAGRGRTRVRPRVPVWARCAARVVV